MNKSSSANDSIHSTHPQDFFEWFVRECHIIAEQAWSARSRDSGTPLFIYYIQTMGCSHGGVIYWLLFSIVTPWMQQALHILANTNVPLTISPTVSPPLGAIYPTVIGRFVQLQLGQQRDLSHTTRQSAIHITLAGCTNIKLLYQGGGHKISSCGPQLARGPQLWGPCTVLMVSDSEL